MHRFTTFTHAPGFLQKLESQVGLMSLVNATQEIVIMRVVFVMSYVIAVAVIVIVVLAVVVVELVL